MDDRKFEIHCDAAPHGQLHVKSHRVSVAISQPVNKNQTEESWQSVLIICDQDPDGSLATKIIVCHPEWDQNLQIACVRSGRRGQGGPGPDLEIDLNTQHV